MRRLGLLFVALFMLTSSGISAEPINKTYKGYPTVNLKMDGLLLHSEVPGINVEGTTLVPIRTIAENMQVDISWDQVNSTVELHTKEPANKNASVVEASLLKGRLYKYGNMVKDLHYKVASSTTYPEETRENILNQVKNTWYSKLDKENKIVLALISDNTLQNKEDLRKSSEILLEINKAYQQIQFGVESYLLYLNNGDEKAKEQYYNLLNTSYDYLTEQLDSCFDWYLEI